MGRRARVSGGLQRPEVQYQLTCPRGFVVGGLDAELTDRAIDLWFLGASGSPVAPGRTTSHTIVFVARVRRPRRARADLQAARRLHPRAGGGRRTPTSFSKVVPPGRPTVRRVRTFRITTPRAVAVSCRRDERLVAAYSASGFRTAKPPSPELVASLSTRPALASGHLTVSARGGEGRAVVQVAAVCAGGR